MSISPIVLVGGSGMIAVALVFFGYAIVRRLGLAFLGMGAAAWFITVAVKFAIAIPANGWLRAKTRLLGEPAGTIVFSIWVGLLTGITEVALVWAFLRFTRFGRARWPGVLAFGIGFGAIEALLLGLASLAAALVVLRMPQRVPEALVQQLAQADSVWIQLAPISERIFACLGHVATNVMLFYAVAQRKSRWFWLAFLYKTVIDAAAGAYALSGSTTALAKVWGMEAGIAVWGIVGVLAIFWISRRYDALTASELPVESEGELTQSTPPRQAPGP